LRKRFDPPFASRSAVDRLKAEREQEIKIEDKAIVKTSVETDGATRLSKRPVAYRMESDMPPPT